MKQILGDIDRDNQGCYKKTMNLEQLLVKKKKSFFMPSERKLSKLKIISLISQLLLHVIPGFFEKATVKRIGKQEVLRMNLHN